MAAGVHRVRRQTWRLRLASAPAAFAARARLRAEVEELLPAFGRAFDAWTPGDTMRHIPRLELALRVRSLDELALKLDEALAEALHREPPLTAVPPPRPAAADHFRVLLHYLRTGLLEWHVAHADPAATAAALRATLRETLPAAVRAAPTGRDTFETAAAYWMRLLPLLPLERWPEAAALLERAAVTGAPQGSGALVAALGALVAGREGLGKRASLALAAVVLAVARFHAPATERLHDTLSRLAGASAPIDAPEPVARILAASKAGAAVPSAEPPTHLARPLKASPAATDARAPEPRPFVIMADDAGLVLLHPFLPTLLEACGLYAPRGGLPSASLSRAAALLHWLARGADEVHEFELAAPKLLLGMRPDEPLAAGPGLVGARERGEGEALLRAAIARWGVLKGTSVDGLRVAFLQRRAALREEDSGWRLQPERESFDVLLDRLPWSLSTVILPWMTRPLFTDWPTR